VERSQERSVRGGGGQTDHTRAHPHASGAAPPPPPAGTSGEPHGPTQMRLWRRRPDTATRRGRVQRRPAAAEPNGDGGESVPRGRGARPPKGGRAKSGAGGRRGSGGLRTHTRRHRGSGEWPPPPRSTHRGVRGSAQGPDLAPAAAVRERRLSGGALLGTAVEVGGLTEPLGSGHARAAASTVWAHARSVAAADTGPLEARYGHPGQAMGAPCCLLPYQIGDDAGNDATDTALWPAPKL